MARQWFLRADSDDLHVLDKYGHYCALTYETSAKVHVGLTAPYETATPLCGKAGRGVGWEREMAPTSAACEPCRKAFLAKHGQEAHDLCFGLTPRAPL